MSEVSVQIDIKLPREQAWARLRNLTLAHFYVPGLVETRINSAITEGVGASRNVYQKRGGYLQETVTEWVDGVGFTLRLHKGEKDAPFKNAFFRYHLADAGPHATRLTATMGYTPPLGRVGATLDQWLLRRIIQGVIADVAIGLKYYYEHGATATNEQRRALRGEVRKLAA